MKILCIGDSLGLPRKGCLYEDTWLSLIRARYPDYTFIDHFHGDRLIDSASHDYDTYYRYYNPDIVIFQQGICDCAPRYIDEKKLLTRVIRKLFYSLGLQNLFWRIVKSHNRRLDCVHTRPEQFIDIYSRLIDNIFKNGSKFVVLIKIGHGADSVIASSPYFNINVDRYNSIIDEIASKYDNVYVVDPLNIINNEMFVDGYHCGPLGMQKVFDSICAVFDNLRL